MVVLARLLRSAARGRRTCRRGSTSPRTSRCSRPARRRGSPTDTWEFTITTETGQGHRWDWAGLHGAAGRRRPRSTCTASPSGPSSAPTGRASRSTPCSPTSRRPPTTRSSRPTAATPPTCRWRTCSTGKAWIAYQYDGEDLQRRARRPGPAAGAAPVPVEERQVGARHHAVARRRAGLLGDRRLPQLRRPVARAAVLGRLSWRVAHGRGGARRRDRRPRARSCSTCRTGRGTWPASTSTSGSPRDDGYTAQPLLLDRVGRQTATAVELTVQRVADGEVSPYLVDGSSPSATSSSCAARSAAGSSGGRRQPEPVLLVAGGSGVVPLMAMVRGPRPAGSPAPFRLVYSVRDPGRVLYGDELAARRGRRRPRRDLRLHPPYAGGLAAPARPARRGGCSPPSACPPASRPTCYVCGPTGFVETVADLLVARRATTRAGSGPNASDPVEAADDRADVPGRQRVAGALGEVFAVDVTAAVGRCAGCGAGGGARRGARVHRRARARWPAAPAATRCCCGWSAPPAGPGSTCAACPTSSQHP